ncbi:MAG: hypothetical protein ACREFR_06215 [Limisphaerales bacterium]
MKQKFWKLYFEPLPHHNTTFVIFADYLINTFGLSDGVAEADALMRQFLSQFCRNLRPPDNHQGPARGPKYPR